VKSQSTRGSIYMDGMPFLAMAGGSDAGGAFQLPLASFVRSLCGAAATGSEVLYDVMLKVALMVDAAAQTYGLATFAQKSGERPRLKWGEGLTHEEIESAEARKSGGVARP